MPELRQEIAGLYSTCAPDDIIVMAPQEGIALAAAAMLAPGDHMIVTFPGYQSLYELARSIGCEVSRWEMRADEKGVLRFEVCASAPYNKPGRVAVCASACGAFPEIHTVAICAGSVASRAGAWVMTCRADSCTCSAYQPGCDIVRAQDGQYPGEGVSSYTHSLDFLLKAPELPLKSGFTLPPLTSFLRSN
jgi:hypothetical protein